MRESEGLETSSITIGREPVCRMLNAGSRHTEKRGKMMRRQHVLSIFFWALIILVIIPSNAEAQRRGRTDGPPGSHIGAGGYEPVGFYRYSMEMHFGAAWSTLDAFDGVPISMGAGLSVWADDWLRLDISGHHLMHNQHTFFLVGPRFQSGFWPISASAGLKAGMAWLPDSGPRFAISPQVGAEMMIGDRLLLGIGWALDIPMDRDPEVVLSHRPHMSLGLRF